MSPSHQMSQDTYVGEYVFTVYRLLAPEYRMTLYTLYLSYDYLLFYIELFRLENEASNLLDLILTSEEGMVHNLNYHPPLGESDHVCLTFTLFYCQQDYQFQPEYNVFKTRNTIQA